MAKPKTLVVEQVPVSSLVSDPANPRKHSERNLSSIKASLQRFGQRKPIVVDKDNVVRAGNGTLQAAKDLGWDSIAVVKTDLAGIEAVAFAIADNRTGELADWDYEVLSDLMRAIMQEEDGAARLVGWEQYEIEPLIKADYTPPPMNNDGDDDTGGIGRRMDSVSLTAEQRQTINRAIAKIRESEGDDGITEGRCLELICADWLSG